MGTKNMCDLGEYQFTHHLTGPLVDVTDDIGERAPEEEMTWLHVFATFQVNKEVMVILKRALRATEGINWVTTVNPEFGSSFALGFDPEVFHDEVARTNLLDAFNKSFRDEATKLKNRGLYQNPAIALNAPVQNNPAYDYR